MPGTPGSLLARARFGGCLVKSRDRNIFGDTGIGPAAFGKSGRLLGDLEYNGFQPEDIDVVFLTHLHRDHLGWSVSEEGEPTLPHTRYVMQVVEREDSGSREGQALAPLESLGDVVVHPAQVTEPLWNTYRDEDKEQAFVTREMLLDWVEADGIISPPVTTSRERASGA